MNEEIEKKVIEQLQKEVEQLKKEHDRIFELKTQKQLLLKEKTTHYFQKPNVILNKIKTHFQNSNEAIQILYNIKTYNILKQLKKNNPEMKQIDFEVDYVDINLILHYEYSNSILDEDSIDYNKIITNFNGNFITSEYEWKHTINKILMEGLHDNLRPEETNGTIYAEMYGDTAWGENYIEYLDSIIIYKVDFFTT
jgi:hypothetical protein